MNLEKQEDLTKIVNPQKLEQTKKEIAAEGPVKLHVVTDFDKTLTYAFSGDRKIGSLIAVLREEGYLSPDYPDKAKALAVKYKPIEDDPNISLSEKSKLCGNGGLSIMNYLNKAA